MSEIIVGEILVVLGALTFVFGFFGFAIKMVEFKARADELISKNEQGNFSVPVKAEVMSAMFGLVSLVNGFIILIRM